MKNDQNISVYEQSVHVYGRIWTGMALILMILTPVAICCYYNAWPPLTAVLKSLLGVAPMYWTVGIIEVFTFVPMLLFNVVKTGFNFVVSAYDTIADLFHFSHEERDMVQYISDQQRREEEKEQAQSAPGPKSVF